MRKSRIKVNAGERGAVYHVMTRTVNGERLFDDSAKEVLRRQIWQISDFCGVEILTYVIMANHFHVLVRVPRTAEVPDDELLRRYDRLYPKPTRFQSARLGVIKAHLESNSAEALKWRTQQLALMGDVSMFMKLLKQRFSIWFNRSHDRFGTLWAERFKSVLVENKRGVLRTIAAYIDLNPVRAGLTSDPKDYRFCGYAEAVVGQRRARDGIVALVEGGRDRAWSWSQSSYRTLLFGVGTKEKCEANSLSVSQLREVIAEGGTLSLATVLRCRVRFFTDGAVLGSREFVNSFLPCPEDSSPQQKPPKSKPLPQSTDWGPLFVLRRLRGQTFG